MGYILSQTMPIVHGVASRECGKNYEKDALRGCKVIQGHQI